MFGADWIRALEETSLSFVSLFANGTISSCSSLKFLNH